MAVSGGRVTAAEREMDDDERGEDYTNSTKGGRMEEHEDERSTGHRKKQREEGGDELRGASASVRARGGDGWGQGGERMEPK